MKFTIPKYRKSVWFLTLIILFTFPYFGCTSVDNPEKQKESIPTVIMVYGPSGLGDQGYNDCIMTGLIKFKKTFRSTVDVYQYSPSSIEEAERIFSEWLTAHKSIVPSLFILGSSDYDKMLSEAMKGVNLPENKQILFFESDPIDNPSVVTFRLSKYGASYLAGICAAEATRNREDIKDALTLLANPHDNSIAAAEKGFKTGYLSRHTGGEVYTEYLAEDWTGYVAGQETYRKMSEWIAKYAFIIPVAGGSNQGIFRFTRDYTVDTLTAGTDVDQSCFSRNIIGSVMKYIDRVIFNYLEHWLTTGKLPDSAVYGLESGYTDWILSPNFRNLQSLIDTFRHEAIIKENTEL